MASHFYEYRDASDRSAYLTMMNAFHALLYPYRKIEDILAQLELRLHVVQYAQNHPVRHNDWPAGA